MGKGIIALDADGYCWRPMDRWELERVEGGAPGAVEEGIQRRLLGFDSTCSGRGGCLSGDGGRWA